MAKVKDAYSNKLYGAVTESAQGTLTFAQIQTYISAFQKEAWTLQRLEWYIPAATINLLNGNSDVISAALVTSNKITDLGLDNPAVVDKFEVGMREIGTAANALLYEEPFARDFTTLPGGGLIVPPRQLFLAVISTSIASAATVECRGYFTRAELDAADYLELIDFYTITQ